MRPEWHSADGLTSNDPLFETASSSQLLAGSKYADLEAVDLSACAEKDLSA